MAKRDVEEQNLLALEKAVRNMLSASRGKKPEEIFNNPDALADYIADAYRVLRSLEPNDKERFLAICEQLVSKYSKRDIAIFVKLQIGATAVEA